MPTAPTVKTVFVRPIPVGFTFKDEPDEVFYKAKGVTIAFSEFHALYTRLAVQAVDEDAIQAHKYLSENGELHPMHRPSLCCCLAQVRRALTPLDAMRADPVVFKLVDSALGKCVSKVLPEEGVYAHVIDHNIYLRLVRDGVYPPWEKTVSRYASHNDIEVWRRWALTSVDYVVGEIARLGGQNGEQ